MGPAKGKGLWILALSLSLALLSSTLGYAEAGRDLLIQKCSACHGPGQDGKLSRIEFQRKSPEGWEMTVTRMQLVNRVPLTLDEKRAIIKYLSDQYGLAPGEIRDFTYILERRSIAKGEEKVPDADVTAVCARCHTYARTALQRRTKEEWVQQAHFHVGAFVTAEYQAGGRNLDFFGLASGKVADTLAKLYPFETNEWITWKAKPKPNLTGRWDMVGYRPGKGSYAGQMEIKGVGEDTYETSWAVEYEDGTKVSGSGSGTVYTGYAWRGRSKTREGRSLFEVHHASEDGTILSGRRFLRDHEETGSDERLYRIDGTSRILSVMPSAVRQGSVVELKIFGTDLPPVRLADIALGPGISAKRIVRADKSAIVVAAEVAGDAPIGMRDVKVSFLMGDKLLTVYDKIDYIKVLPERALARTGGDTVPKELAQFEAIGFSNGPDGAKGTEDDIRVGLVKTRWSIEDYRVEWWEDDIYYVGSIDQNGLFTPAGEGPNPERKWQTNNYGDIWVVATHTPEGASRPLKARAFLIVTAPRWNNPPLK